MAATFYTRAFAAERVGLADDAIADYSTVVKLAPPGSPARAAALFNRANLRDHARGETSAAIADLDEACPYVLKER